MKRLKIHTITLTREGEYDEWPEFDLPDDAQVVAVHTIAHRWCVVQYVTTTIQSQAAAVQ